MPKATPPGPSGDLFDENSPALAHATLLLVDDNEATLLALAGLLEAQGYQVHTARSGPDAIAQTQAHPPHAILLDIQMPGMDGLEVMRRLRANPDQPQVPIIALTALAMPGDRDRCLQAGANAYLSKPVRLKELVRTIQDLPAPEAARGQPRPRGAAPVAPAILSPLSSEGHKAV